MQLYSNKRIKMINSILLHNDGNRELWAVCPPDSCCCYKFTRIIKPTCITNTGNCIKTELN